MKNKINNLFPLLFLLLIAQHFLVAQPTEQRIKVIVAPDHSDWTYKVNEKVKFTISVLQDGNLLKGAKIKYEVGPEKMEAIKKDSIILSSGTISVDGGSLKIGGFLRCVVIAKVEGKEYRGFATAGFDPLTIQPTVENPTDFKQFWDQAKTELSKIPLDAKMTLLPERCTENVNVYHVNLQNFRLGSRLYGILCIPKKEGKYPALLKVPGAGVRPYAGDVAMAEKGIITFEIGIHGISVTMDPSVYSDLGNGALNQYYNYNLDNRDRYYYKRVYVGCVRANDFLVS